MSDADKIRAEIELTRAELAHTVDELHSRLDVKALATQRAQVARARAMQFAERNQRALVLAGSTVLVLMMLRRRRRRGD